MDWYEEEVRQLIEKRDSLSYAPQTVFYGSSSIRLWETMPEDFAPFLPVNLGFGGSTMEACVHYFDWIVTPVSSAQKLIIYAGDNDLGDGRSPDELLLFFRQMKSLIREHFPDIPSYYLSIKPSLARWNINENIRQANHLIESEIEAAQDNMKFINIYDAMLNESSYPNKDYYDEDGLHLTRAGYEVWKQILLAQVFANKITDNNFATAIAKLP